MAVFVKIMCEKNDNYHISKNTINSETVNYLTNMMLIYI
jgi:hypothetical protein